MKLDPTRPPESDDYYLGIALAVRRKANCTGNRVAAVIVKNKRVISTGYNGVPEGMKNCLDGGCLRCLNPNGQFMSGTGYDLCICVHAEQNALLAAARHCCRRCSYVHHYAALLWLCQRDCPSENWHSVLSPPMGANGRRSRNGQGEEGRVRENLRKAAC